VVFPDGREASWDCKSGLKDITLAYAITVHKSQGSEYDTILMPVTKIRMFNRNLLYTGISRAKKQVLLMGDMEALDAGLRTYPEPRKSGLVGRVKQQKEDLMRKKHVA
jgi:exodeoxyribonuclease V alpha subunit